MLSLALSIGSMSCLKRRDDATVPNFPLASTPTAMAVAGSIGWPKFKRFSVRIARRSRILSDCYKRRFKASFTDQCLLQLPSLGSIHSGTPCAPIPISKSSASKSSWPTCGKELIAFGLFPRFQLRAKSAVRRKGCSGNRSPPFRPAG